MALIYSNTDHARLNYISVYFEKDIGILILLTNFTWCFTER